MPVLSRTRVAATCAALSTVAVAGMAALTVLVGDRSCDLTGCPAVAVTTVRAADVSDICAAPSTTPSTALPEQTGDPGSCTVPTAGAPGTGGMATARVPAP